MARLLVKDTPNTWLRGDVLFVAQDGFKFGRSECYKTHIERGGEPKGWEEKFIIIDVPDASVSDLEYLAFRDDNGNALYTLEDSDSDSPLNKDLLVDYHAEITTEQLNAIVRVY